jgi:hypothetical protein
VPPGGTLTIDARPNPITFGRATAISGGLSPPVGESSVTLQANPAPFTAGFQNVATASTDANGNYAFRDQKPALNTRYRTLTECVTICPLDAVVLPCPIVASPLPCPGGTTSPELLVQVRIKVVLQVSSAPKPGGRVRFFGTAAPEHGGQTVHIQRRTRKRGWVDVKRTISRDAGPNRSRFSARIGVRAGGTYRALVDPDTDHAQGTSRPKRV